MKELKLRRGAGRLGLTGVLAAVSALAASSPALAHTTSPVDTSACSAPTLTQPFTWARDANWYTLAPGQIPGQFNGAGWTLSGGASVATTTQSDGSAHQVLNLPSGSQAVSPTICVNADFKTVRAEVRNVVGAEGVQFYVSYAGMRSWGVPQAAGQLHGQASAWTLANPLNTHVTNSPTWQLVRFTFVPGGKTSDFQMYDFYVDPRCRG